MKLTISNRISNAITILCLLICTALNTFPRWIHPILMDEFNKWQAISFVFLAAASVFLNKSKLVRIVFDWVLFLSINNMVDEIWGEPTNTSTGELLFAAIVTTWTIYRLNQCRINKK